MINPAAQHKTIKQTTTVFIFFLALTGICQAQMDTGLAAWWKLDDGSGTKAADASGNGHDGDIAGGAAWTQGLLSPNALSFDGASGYVQIPNGILDLTQSFSIAMWINPTTFNPLPDSNKQRLFSIIGKDGGTLDLATFPKENAACLSFITTAGGVTKSYTTSDAQLETGYWHLVILVFDGSSYTMYINGQVDPLQSGGITIAGKQTSYIGNTKNPDPGNFNGKIEDVRFYSRALSASEISQYYNSLIKS